MSGDRVRDRLDCSLPSVSATTAPAKALCLLPLSWWAGTILLLFCLVFAAEDRQLAGQGSCVLV